MLHDDNDDLCSVTAQPSAALFRDRGELCIRASLRMLREIYFPVELCALKSYRFISPARFYGSR